MCVCVARRKVAIPENPKPHVWKVAWKGVKYIRDQVYKEVSINLLTDITYDTYTYLVAYCIAENVGRRKHYAIQLFT